MRTLETGAQARRVEASFGVQTSGQRRMRQVLRGAAERDMEMMVIGIDDRAPTCQVGGDHDGLLLQPESPTRRVVGGGGERRVTHPLIHRVRAVSGVGGKRAPQAASKVLLILAR